MAIAITATGAAFVIAGVAVLCALVCTPLAGRARDMPLKDINDPIQLGWAATARLLRPAAVVAVVAGLLNLVLQLLD